MKKTISILLCCVFLFALIACFSIGTYAETINGYNYGTVLTFVGQGTFYQVQNINGVKSDYTYNSVTHTTKVGLDNIIGINDSITIVFKSNSNSQLATLKPIVALTTTNTLNNTWSYDVKIVNGFTYVYFNYKFNTGSNDTATFNFVTGETTYSVTPYIYTADVSYTISYSNTVVVGTDANGVVNYTGKYGDTLNVLITSNSEITADCDTGTLTANPNGIDYLYTFVFGVDNPVVIYNNGGVGVNTLTVNALTAKGSAMYYQQYYKGYQDGIKDLKLQIEDAYNKGKSDGFVEGKKAGITEGIGMADTSTFDGLFSAVVDAPIHYIFGWLNFDIFGVNMFGVFQFVITVLVCISVFFIIKKFIK